MGRFLYPNGAWAQGPLPLPKFRVPSLVDSQKSLCSILYLPLLRPFFTVLTDIIRCPC